MESRYRKIPRNIAFAALLNTLPGSHFCYELFCHLDAVDQITLSVVFGWYLEEPEKALEEGTMEYAGKCSAPDYERIR